MDLSQNLRLIMSKAFNKAREVNNEYLMPEHILYSIIESDEEVTEKLNIDQEEILEDLNLFFEQKVPKVSEGTNPVESLGFNQVIQFSVKQVEDSQRSTVEVEDVLVAIYSINGQAHYILQKYGINKEDIISIVSDIQREAMENKEEGTQENGKTRKKKSLLEEFAVELVSKAKEGKIDPIIGRNDEIERTVQILCRKKKNNPIHVGESGVGKCLHSDEEVLILVSDEIYEELKNFI